MHVLVVPSVNEIRTVDLTQRTVIVIDVLRASSTIVTALHHGATGVIPAETVSQAKQMATFDDVLGGERFCKKITGFHKGNSPYEYMSDELTGKRIILTTSNGTRALHKAQRADYILAGAIINARATAEAALQLQKDITLLCSGAQDEFAFEDGLCAGLIFAELMKAIGNEHPLTINDFGYMMYSAYCFHAHQMSQVLLSCTSGKRLTKLGYAEDVPFCALPNTHAIVPIFDQHILKPFAKDGM